MVRARRPVMHLEFNLLQTNAIKTYTLKLKDIFSLKNEQQKYKDKVT
jgi:hypothetical protein